MVFYGLLGGIVELRRLSGISGTVFYIFFVFFIDISVIIANVAAFRSAGFVVCR